MLTNTTLFLARIPFSVTRAELTAAISENYPGLESCKLNTNKRGESRGYAHLSFSTPEDAAHAMRHLDGAVWDGESMACELATPKDVR